MSMFDTFGKSSDPAKRSENTMKKLARLNAALQHQDSQLAGSIVLILSALTVIGILLSDILLAVVDPRIRGSV